MRPREYNSGKRRLDPTVSLFVSLYLILLAFFIVMNQISNQQTARAVAAMQSLERAFERPFPEPAKTPGLAPPESHPASDPAFLIEAGELVSSLVGPPQASATQGGNLLQLRLDSHALFFAGSTGLSEQAGLLLDRLAELLAGAPPGMRREVIALFGQDGREGELASARADRLARALEDAGAPAGAIAVGLLRARRGREIRLDFRTAPLAQSRLRLAVETEL